MASLASRLLFRGEHGPRFLGTLPLEGLSCFAQTHGVGAAFGCPVHLVLPCGFECRAVGRCGACQTEQADAQQPGDKDRKPFHAVVALPEVRLAGWNSLCAVPQAGTYQRSYPRVIRRWMSDVTTTRPFIAA
ncbi:MAG: hypothetical protein KIT73_06600 [Burkholderiales bacterium]|nr:hypothetical protein [Burkholderiales bacterium]